MFLNMFQPLSCVFNPNLFTLILKKLVIFYYLGNNILHFKLEIMIKSILENFDNVFGQYFSTKN